MGETQSVQPSTTRRDAVQAVREVEVWLWANWGVVQTIGGPGCRKPSAELKRWFRPDWGNGLWGPDTSMFGAATLVRAVDVLRGRRTALRYFCVMQKTRPGVCTFSEMVGLLRQMRTQFPPQLYARIHLERLKKAKRPAFQKRPYELLYQQHRCLVVQLERTGHVNHMVFVNGRRNLVWDNSEEYQLEFKPESLRKFCGFKST